MSSSESFPHIYPSPTPSGTASALARRSGGAIIVGLKVFSVSIIGIAIVLVLLILLQPEGTAVTDIVL